MLSRRNFLLLILLLLGVDFGVGRFLRPAPPPGWRIEHWEAGFGSWANGGFGVAYDVAVPPEYSLTQKCGAAWIAGGDDDAPEDYRVKLSFAPTPAAQRSQFAEYMKSDAPRTASDLGRSAADIELGDPAPFNAGALGFSRRELLLRGARFDNPPRTATARGFYLTGEKLAIVADLQSGSAAAINERIVRSLRRSRGVGLTELLLGALPNLFGC